MLNLQNGGADIDSLIIDNSRDEFNYFRKLSGELEDFPHVTVAHYEPGKKDPAMHIHATVCNLARSIALDGDYDYLLIHESDVIPASTDLIELLKAVNLFPHLEAVFSGIVPYDNNTTLIYKKLKSHNMDEEGAIQELVSLSLSWGQKIGNMEVRVPRYTYDKWIPDIEYFKMNELDNFKEPFPVAGCSLGFTLIPRAVLEDVLFRAISSSSAMADVWFCIDVRHTGHEIFCVPSVRPQHLWKKWEGII